MLGYILNKFVITPQELINLFRHSDQLDQTQIKKDIFRCYKSITKVCIMQMALCILMTCILISSSYMLINKNMYIVFGVSVAVFTLVEVVLSFFANRYVNYAFTELLLDKFNIFRKEFERYLTPEISVEMNEFYANFNGYGYTLTQIFERFCHFLIILVSVSFMRVPLWQKGTIFGISLCLIGIFAITGHFFHKASIKVRDNLLQNKAPDSRSLQYRVSLPLVYNLINTLIIPLTTILLAVYNLNQLIPQLAILSNLALFSWTLIENLQKFRIANTNLGKLSKYFEELTARYVVNENGYRRVTELSKPSDETILESKYNALILRKFIPKYIKNGRYSKRKINFKFMPGIYQLHGMNGVGKSTLLESISLSPDERVELCAGEAALNGKPLYEPNTSLASHRTKVRYIGKYSKPPVKLDMSGDMFKAFPLIFGIVKELDKYKKDKYSDGERAILLILDVLDEIKMHDDRVKVVIIDEMISRIYEDDITELRSEVLHLIDYFASKHKIIFIIVDHVIKVKNAKHIYLSKDGLDTSKDYVSVVARKVYMRA